MLDFPPGQFGGYTSFLEIAFVLNGLFAGWRAIPDNLAARRAGVGKYAERPGAEAYDNVSKWSKGVIRWGRRCGALFAFLIVVGLFAIADGTPINGLGATAVFLSVTPLPLTLVLVYAIYWMFLAWLTVRNLKSFFAFWTLMFRLARKLR